MKELPTIVATIGDPAGIGPEVLVKSFRVRRARRSLCRPILVGDTATVERACKVCNVDRPVRSFRSLDAVEHGTGAINVIDTGELKPDSYVVGQPSEASGHAVLAWLGLRHQALLERRGRRPGVGAGQQHIAGAHRQDQSHRRSAAGRHLHVPRQRQSARGADHRAHSHSRHRGHGDARPRARPDRAARPQPAQLGPAEAAHRRCRPQPARHVRGGSRGGCARDQPRRASKASTPTARSRPILVFRMALGGKFDAIVTMYHDQGQVAVKTSAFEGACTICLGPPLTCWWRSRTVRPMTSPAPARRSTTICLRA